MRAGSDIASPWSYQAVIWDYFSISKDSDKFATCSACKDSVSHEGSLVKNFNTTKLINHLKKKHPPDNTDYEEKNKIRGLKENQKQKEQTPYDDNRSRNQSQSMGY